MPDEAWPGVVQHPLNDACGFVFVAAIRFKHRALAFEGHGLRLPRIVGSVFCFSVPHFQRMGEKVDVLEFTAACVKIPLIGDRPKFILGKESF